MQPQEQTRDRQIPPPRIEPKAREVFPYLNNLKNSISDGERYDKKVEVLSDYRETISDLSLLSRSLKEIGSLKEEKKALAPNSKEIKTVTLKIEDNLTTIRQILENLEHSLPETGWLDTNKNKNISVLAKDDYVALLYEKFNEKETIDLMNVANQVKSIGINSVSTQELNETTERFHFRNQDALMHLDRSSRMSSTARSKGDYPKAESFIEEGIRVTIPHQASPLFNEMEQIALRMPGREILNELHFEFSTPSKILDLEYNKAFSIRSENPLDNVPFRERASIVELQNSLWDHKISWTNTTNAEADVRFIETAYATHKRLGMLFSSLRSSLSEIDKLSAEVRPAERLKTFEQFWKLYDETTLYIADEMKATLAKTDPSLADSIAEPYKQLSRSLSALSPQSVSALYSEEDLKSTSKCFNNTREITNQAFKIVSQGLKNIGASPSDVMTVLERFKALNESHPEKQNIDAWATGFKQRFRELGVK
jgi:hypothetical protein